MANLLFVFDQNRTSTLADYLYLKLYYGSWFDFPVYSGSSFRRFLFEYNLITLGNMHFLVLSIFDFARDEKTKGYIHFFNDFSINLLTGFPYFKLAL